MKDTLLILPELLLTLTLAFVVIAEITYHSEQVRLVTATSLVGLLAAFAQVIATYQAGPAHIFSGALSVDGLSLFFKLFFIMLAAFSILFASHNGEIPPGRRTEYTALILASTLAMCLAAGSTDMLLTYLSLQFVNILGCFLAGYGKRSVLSIEAAIKHMAFSSVAGALLLYGLALLFASTHSLNVHQMHEFLTASPLPHGMTLVAFMLVFLALCFQFGAFPMYLWTPDVLEGAPTPAAGFIAVGTRAVGFAVAIRFLITVFGQPSGVPGQWQPVGSLDWTRIVALVSGLTMMVGALLSLRQAGAKRLVACLVIVQSGFLLMGLLVLDQVGIAALLYNLVIELFALIGTFYVLAFFIEQTGSDKLEDLKGMLGRAVPECICLVLFLLCLVGVPPSPGFLGKFALIGAAVRHQWYALAVLAIASLALTTVAITRLAFHLIGDIAVQPPARSLGAAAASSKSFDEPSVAGQERIPINNQRRLFLFATVVPMLLAGVFAEYVLDWAGKSLGFILW